MPAILHQSNHTISYPTDGFADSSEEPRMQGLLFNTAAVLFVAASLVKACIYFVHQRKDNRAPKDNTTVTSTEHLSETRESNGVHVSIPSNSMMQEDEMGDNIEMDEREVFS